LPLVDQVAAISCGIFEGTPVLDLDYPEDSNADADANFVLTGQGQICEIQATAEESLFSPDSFNQLLALAQKGCAELAELQRQAIHNT
jgi:ribonuclease PH